MATPEQNKTILQIRYSEIAKKALPIDLVNSALQQKHLKAYPLQNGYIKEANLNLGCGLPTLFIEINPGDHVIDLGCGLGIDCFIAAHKVGDDGFVTGIDLSPEMIERADDIRQENKIGNIEYIQADMEEIPLPGQQADVAISNCAINMASDKGKVFREIHRMLRPAAQFCISDIVITGDMPYKIRQAAEACYGYVAGAIDRNQYIRLIQKSGFVSLEIMDEHGLEIPQNILEEFADESTIEHYRQNEAGIHSITITGYKAINIKPVIGLSGVDDQSEIAELLSECKLSSHSVNPEEDTVFSIQYRNQLVALLSFKTTATCGVITALATHPAFRQQKLASLLHDHFIRDCQLADQKQFYIKTHQSIDWFKQKGWQTIHLESIPQEILDSEAWQSTPINENAVCMRLDIE